MAEKLAEAGCHDLAEQLASSIAEPGWRAQALAALALCAASEHQANRASALAEQAQDMMKAHVTDPAGQARILATVASAMTASGRPDQAAPLLQQAVATASGIGDADERARVTALLARLSGAQAADQDTTAAAPGAAGTSGGPAGPAAHRPDRSG